MKLLTTNFAVNCIVYLVFIVVMFFASYGVTQLCTCSSRFTLIEAQRSEIANLETKIMFLENNDWALAIQNMSETKRYELKALNEQIKQKKYKKYKENNANR